MKFQSLKSGDHELQDGGLQGFVTATYRQLVQCFGASQDETSDAGKIACQWDLLFDDGTYASVYSFEDPTGRVPKTPRGRYHWHISGVSNDAVNRVAEALRTVDYEYFPPKDHVPAVPVADEQIPF